MRAAVRNLATEPKPARSIKIKARENCYRIRVGDYRIVYRVCDKESSVLVIRIGRRNESTYDF